MGATNLDRRAEEPAPLPLGMKGRLRARRSHNDGIIFSLSGPPAAHIPPPLGKLGPPPFPLLSLASIPTAASWPAHQKVRRGGVGPNHRA